MRVRIAGEGGADGGGVGECEGITTGAVVRGVIVAGAGRGRGVRTGAGAGGPT